MKRGKAGTMLPYPLCPLMKTTSTAIRMEHYIHEIFASFWPGYFWQHLGSK